MNETKHSLRKCIRPQCGDCLRASMMIRACRPYNFRDLEGQLTLQVFSTPFDCSFIRFLPSRPMGDLAILSLYAASRDTEGLYSSPCASTAHVMRASLLASATATLLLGARAASCRTQRPSPLVSWGALKSTDRAP